MKYRSIKLTDINTSYVEEMQGDDEKDKHNSKCKKIFIGHSFGEMADDWNKATLFIDSKSDQFAKQLWLLLNEVFDFAASFSLYLNNNAWHQGTEFLEKMFKREDPSSEQAGVKLLCDDEAALTLDEEQEKSIKKRPVLLWINQLRNQSALDKTIHRLISLGAEEIVAIILNNEFSAQQETRCHKPSLFFLDWLWFKYQQLTLAAYKPPVTALLANWDNYNTMRLYYAPAQDSLPYAELQRFLSRRFKEEEMKLKYSLERYWSDFLLMASETNGVLIKYIDYATVEACRRPGVNEQIEKQKAIRKAQREDDPTLSDSSEGAYVAILPPLQRVYEKVTMMRKLEKPEMPSIPPTDRPAATLITMQNWIEENSSKHATFDEESSVEEGEPPSPLINSPCATFSPPTIVLTSPMSGAVVPLKEDGEVDEQKLPDEDDELPLIKKDTKRKKSLDLRPEEQKPLLMHPSSPIASKAADLVTDKAALLLEEKTDELAPKRF